MIFCIQDIIGNMDRIILAVLHVIVHQHLPMDEKPDDPGSNPGQSKKIFTLLPICVLSLRYGSLRCFMSKGIWLQACSAN